MADDPNAWTEHQHGDGRRYFYNRVPPRERVVKAAGRITARE